MISWRKNNQKFKFNSKRRGGYNLTAEKKGGSAKKELPFDFGGDKEALCKCLLLLKLLFIDGHLHAVPLTLSRTEGEYPMKDLVTQIARALVDKPEEVAVAEVEGNQTSVLELRVAKEDIGKVIGKQGRIAQAMRTIVSSVSAKEKKRTVLEIMD